MLLNISTLAGGKKEGSINISRKSGWISIHSWRVIAEN